MEEHPAYIKIFDIPAGYKRDPKVRDRLREQIANVFRARRPTLSAEQAYRLANVSLQIVKSMNALYAQGNQRRGCLSPAESQVSTLLDAVVSPQTTTASPPLVWALWRLST